MSFKKKEPFKQGIFYPLYKDKCLNKSKIEYRSNLELIMMQKLDKNANILEWSSEKIIINYYNIFKDPYRLKDGKVNARYYVDFYFKTKSGKKIWAEIKPEKQIQHVTGECVIKKTKNKKQSTVDYETNMKILNEAKWTAAKKAAYQNGCDFICISEKDLAKIF